MKPPNDEDSDTPSGPSPTVDADERGDLVLKRTEDLGKTFTIIHEDIYSFGYIGAFLFFSVMEDPVSGSHCHSIQPYIKMKKQKQNPRSVPIFLPTAHVRIVKILFSLQRSPRVMYFSSDQGDTFSRALLPSASTEQVGKLYAFSFYRVLGRFLLIIIPTSFSSEATYLHFS